MRYWRRPSWFALLLLIAGVVLFVRLGVWQLHRANEKDALLSHYAAAAVAVPQDFSSVANLAPGDALAHVRVQGEYLVDHVYLLDNPRHDQRGGVEVYVPFRPQGHARWLLVDLGFLPGNGSGQVPPLSPLPPGVRSLQGLFVPPPGVGFRMGGNALARQPHWPKTTVYLDLDEVAADLDEPLYPRVLSLDADPAAIYQRNHEPDFSAMPPARHRAYAFQWFTFAVAAVVIFIVLHRRRRRPSDRT